MTQTAAAKEKILSSIRQNLAASRAFDSQHSHADHAPAAATQTTATSTDPVEVFKRELEGLGVACHAADDRAAAKQTITEILDELGVTKVAVSDMSLTDLLPENEIDIVIDAPRDYLFEADLGITGAQFAIAETGTLVLFSGRERNRLTSLVPPVHVCVLNASDVRHTMEEVLSVIDTNANRVVTFITGASRTSDIELTLAIGVHGPKRLIVVLIAG